MPSPLYDEAGYIRPPKKLGTKSEVLAGLFADLETKLGTQYEVESKEARQRRHDDELLALSHFRMNERASRKPEPRPTGDTTWGGSRNYRGSESDTYGT